MTRSLLVPALPLALGLLTCASASAQVFSLSESGNATFELTDIPQSPTADAARIRFTGDAATAPSIAFSFWWYYRLAGDARESSFNDSGSQVTVQSSGKRGVLRWDDVDGRGLEATYFITVHSTGPANAMNVHHMTVTNRTGAPVTLDLFAYADLDHCGDANRDSASGTLERHTITDPSCPGSDAEFFGIDPSSCQVGNFPTVLDALVDSNVTDLPGTGLPYTSSDYTAAMQWTSPVLADGESFRAVAAISHGHQYLDCGPRAASRTFGVPTPGASGPPEILTVIPPVIYSSAELLIRNGPPGGNASLLYGSAPLNGDLGVTGFGISIYVSRGSTPLTFDSNGEVSLLLPLPLQATDICGFPFYFQAFALDPTSTAQFGITATGAVEWTIGH